LFKKSVDKRIGFEQGQVIGLFTDDFGKVMNAYYLLTFPLTAVLCLLVLRRLGLSRWPAVVVSVLYALLPYHTCRYYHIFLMGYYLVPAMVLAALWVWSDAPPFFARSGEGRPRFTLRSGRGWAAVVIVALVVTGGPYYAFFGGFLLLVAGLLGTVLGRRRQPLLAAGVLLAAMLVIAAANLAPYLVHYHRHGFNMAAPRSGADVEKYGVKIAAMLLPVPQHILPPLAAMRRAYTRWSGMNDLWSIPLGLAGAFGFLYLIGWMVWRTAPRLRRTPPKPRADDRWSRLLSRLSVLNLAALLLGTIGGLSSLVALGGFSLIRCYDRMIVYFGFLALAAVGVLLERLWRSWGRTPARRAARGPLLGLLLLAGAVDQSSPSAVPDYPRMQATYDADRAFFGRIEAALPPGAMVFHLPAVQFPGRPPTDDMKDYDQLMGYLHSHRLRWSSGAVFGRYPSAWLRWAVRKPPRAFLRTICRAGFRGLCVDRYGCSPWRERDIADVLDARPLVSGDNRRAFYDLRSYAAGLAAAGPPPPADELFPLLWTWDGGYHDAEEGTADRSRWSCWSSWLRLHNPADRTRRVTVSFSLMTAHSRPSVVRLSAPLSRRVEVARGPVPVVATVELPPGDTVIRMDYESGPGFWDSDSKAFRVLGLDLTAAGPAAGPAGPPGP